MPSAAAGPPDDEPTTEPPVETDTEPTDVAGPTATGEGGTSEADESATGVSATSEGGTAEPTPGKAPDQGNAHPVPAEAAEPAPGQTPDHGDAERTPTGPPEPAPSKGSEHGDRGWFLASARERLAGGIPTNPVHPPPEAPGGPGTVPEPTYANLDPDDLVGTFVQAVEEAGGVCHRVEDDVPDALLDRLVAELNAWEVVVSAEPEAVALGERLAGRGVEVARATPEAAARAALGVTSAVAGIAATGSVVLDSRQAGGRLASLLPAVHLCVLPVERLLATPGDLLRTLGTDPETLPPALVIETGPSRTGDIEQLLTLGAHGPTRLHIVLVG